MRRIVEYTGIIILLVIAWVLVLANVVLRHG